MKKILLTALASLIIGCASEPEKITPHQGEFRIGVVDTAPVQTELVVKATFREDLVKDFCDSIPDGVRIPVFDNQKVEDVLSFLYHHTTFRFEVAYRNGTFILYTDNEDTRMVSQDRVYKRRMKGDSPIIRIAIDDKDVVITTVGSQK